MQQDSDEDLKTNGLLVFAILVTLSFYIFFSVVVLIAVFFIHVDIQSPWLDWSLWMGLDAAVCFTIVFDVWLFTSKTLNDACTNFKQGVKYIFQNYFPLKS